MHQHGHYGAALIVYAPLAFVVTALGFNRLALGGGVVAVALAMVPDLDQRVPGASHRGITHTVWFAVLVGVVLGVVGSMIGGGTSLLAMVGLGGFGFLVGAGTIISHIAADALTPMGVRPLVPFNDREYGFDVVTAANPLANIGLLILGGAVSVGAFAIGRVFARTV